MFRVFRSSSSLLGRASPIQTVKDGYIGGFKNIFSLLLEPVRFGLQLFIITYKILHTYTKIAVEESEGEETRKEESRHTRDYLKIESNHIIISDGSALQRWVLDYSLLLPAAIRLSISATRSTT